MWLHAKDRPTPTQVNNSLPPMACDLKYYVFHNKPSIFVGTTQPYQTADGRLMSWQWHVTCRNLHHYKYEIFAYRGVTINQVLSYSSSEAYSPLLHNTSSDRALQIQNTYLSRVSGCKSFQRRINSLMVPSTSGSTWKTAQPLFSLAQHTHIATLLTGCCGGHYIYCSNC